MQKYQLVWKKVWFKNLNPSLNYIFLNYIIYVINNTY